MPAGFAIAELQGEGSINPERRNGYPYHWVNGNLSAEMGEWDTQIAVLGSQREITRCLMKIIRSAMTMCIALALCAPSVRYVSLPGYKFQTDPTCLRVVSKTKFDRICDRPKLGFKDFSPPISGIIGI